MSVKTVLRLVMAVLMVTAGIAHLRNPAPFVRIVPSALPAPRILVFVSGVCECLGGLGLLVPRTRRFAAWGLIALFVAVFPANVNMAMHDIPISGRRFSPLLLWLRLPLQAVLIAWAYWLTKDSITKD